MHFIDSHAHLNDPAFDPDRDDLLRTELRQAGLVGSIEIGCAPTEWAPATALAEQYPGLVYAVLGVHPEYAPLYQPQHGAQLAALLQHPKVVAVGETGLDYTCLDVAPKTLQHQTFCQMIALADQNQKPLVLHVRRQDEDYAAYEDTFACLKHHWQAHTRTAYPGVLHCFCARYEEAKKALDMGLLLGVNGCFTYKKNEYIREAIKKVGIKHIILETDCPYLSPQGKRGTRNTPANIPLLAQWMADYLNIPVEELAYQTTQQTKKLYAIP